MFGEIRKKIWVWNIYIYCGYIIMIINCSVIYDFGIIEYDVFDVYIKWKEFKVVVVDLIVKFIVF